LIQIGSSIELFGISFGYLWWGYVAAFTEFFGGIALIVNFFPRLVSLPLICLFIVAIKYHLHKGDPFSVWGFAFICLAITIGVLITGKGYDKKTTPHNAHE
jgi:putative oxidoreductase